jgi:hypothetical protein
VKCDAFNFKVLEFSLTIMFVIEICKICGFSYLIGSICI